MFINDLMHQHLLTRGTIMLLLIGCIATSTTRADDGVEYFETHVRPLLAEHCFECHGPKKQQAGLRLDKREFLIKGNDSGPAVVVGKPDESRLLQVVRYADDDTQMPPKGRLSDDQVAKIKHWIEMGAPWPATVASSMSSDNQNSWKSHWSFQPIARPAIPVVHDTQWPVDPIDHFVLAALEQRQMRPAHRADAAALLKRIMFDLTGLTPTYDEINAIQQDSSQSAIEAVVDRLLDTPQFGERWARHWMDVARYADTTGYVFTADRNLNEAHLYRDWLVQSFNADNRIDEFLIQQLAADKIVAPDDGAQLAAMGFLTLGRRFLNNQHDIIDDRIDVVTRGLMGLTVTCARCHDHKYDPIPSADYYSLYGVFNSSDEPRDAPSTLRLVDRDKPREPIVFLRGNSGNRGPRVPRRFLSVLAGPDAQPFQQGSGRLEMAQAIASPDNPLTARVFVNRVWGHLIGSELVNTPSDFGIRSDPPTHPELLDHLASTFIDDGWSLKTLIRRIVRSATYQQSSQSTVDFSALDPENKLLWHMNRRRRELESHRDCLLSVAGRLDMTVGGPSVKVHEAPFSTRRSLYAFIDRQNLPSFFRTFDLASPDAHSPRRYQTTVPQQALFQLNSPFLLEQANHLARLSGPDDASVDDRITAIYRRVFARDPDSSERELGRAFVETALSTTDAGPLTVWQYGRGRIDGSSRQVSDFTRLNHFTGDVWQTGPKLPDEKLGYVSLRKSGGHPGNNHDLAVIRRWTAEIDGTVEVHGSLHHPSDQGDGVRGTITADNGTSPITWDVRNSRVDTHLPPTEVRRGDTIDFVIDCRSNSGYDSFHWTVDVILTPNDSKDAVRRTNSERDFSGPAPEPLDFWSRYVQVLLLSNEFVFVD